MEEEETFLCFVPESVHAQAQVCGGIQAGTRTQTLAGSTLTSAYPARLLPTSARALGLRESCRGAFGDGWGAGQVEPDDRGLLGWTDPRWRGSCAIPTKCAHLPVLKTSGEDHGTITRRERWAHLNHHGSCQWLWTYKTSTAFLIEQLEKVRTSAETYQNRCADEDHSILILTFKTKKGKFVQKDTFIEFIYSFYSGQVSQAPFLISCASKKMFFTTSHVNLISLSE